MKRFKCYKAEEASPTDPIEAVYVGFIPREDVTEAILAPEKYLQRADVGLVPTDVGPATDIELVASSIGGVDADALTIVVKHRHGKPGIICLVNTHPSPSVRIENLIPVHEVDRP